MKPIKIINYDPYLTIYTDIVYLNPLHIKSIEPADFRNCSRGVADAFRKEGVLTQILLDDRCYYSAEPVETVASLFNPKRSPGHLK